MKIRIKRRVNDMIICMPMVYTVLALISSGVGTIFCLTNRYEGAVTIVQGVCVAICTFFLLMLLTVIGMVHLDLDTTSNFSRDELREERKKRRVKRRQLNSCHT